MRLRGNAVMIGVGDAGGYSGACVEVGGDGCWRSASGADDDGDDCDVCWLRWENDGGEAGDAHGADRG